MFEAYLWEEPSFGYASDGPIEVLEVLQEQCEDGIGETYFLIADRKKGRFFRVNMRRFHTCYPSGTTDVEFQQDLAEHIKVQYHDEELTLRQLIDRLDKTIEDRDFWEQLCSERTEMMQEYRRKLLGLNKNKGECNG